MDERRWGAGTAVLASLAALLAAGCTHAPRAVPEAAPARGARAATHFTEIVSADADALCALYGRLHGLTFGAPDPDLGQARVAVRGDGTLLGIRKPLAAHEGPIVRTYVAVADIQQAVKEAEALGATVAYPPTLQGQRGTFAILLAGGVQHGLWQR